MIFLFRFAASLVMALHISAFSTPFLHRRPLQLHGYKARYYI